MQRILLYRGVVILAPRVFETHGRVSSGWAQPAKQLDRYNFRMLSFA